MAISIKTKVPLLERFSTQLLILILLVFVPSLILTLHTNIQERRARRLHTRDGIMATAQLAAAKQENFVKNAEQLLATVSQFEFLVLTSDRRFSEVHFSNLRQLSPEYLDIGLVDADGRLFCSTVISNRVVEFSNWSCVQRVLKTGRFAIGDFGKDGTTREDTLDFGYPIFNKDGRLKRVLFASLDLARVRETATRMNLPRDAQITVFDDGGNILARNPDHESLIGESMAHDPYVQRLLKGDAGEVFEMSGLDKVEKLFATTAVNDGLKGRLWISVGIPTKTLFANANQDLWKSILIMVSIFFLALVVAYLYAEHLLLRPLYSLTEEASLLAAGKWKARPEVLKGRGELAVLSRTFREMAVTLERHRQDVEAANAVLEQRVHDRTRALEQATEELESFSYSVSHDLRAPLRHIAGFVDLLRDDLGDSVRPKTARFLNIIDDSAKQMGNLIDDLLMFSKMGRVEMQTTMVNTAELFDETIRSLEPELKNRNFDWVIHPLPKVQADPAMLRQVFANLVSNAVKYTLPRNPARIEVGYEEKDHEVIIFIRDDGVGFDMNFADKLFGVFQRLHRSDEFEGTGIGLANVRRIILRHGGRTWAEGKVNEGAIFYFSLPKPDKTTG